MVKRLFRFAIGWEGVQTLRLSCVLGYIYVLINRLMRNIAFRAPYRGVSVEKVAKGNADRNGEVQSATEPGTMWSWLAVMKTRRIIRWENVITKLNVAKELSHCCGFISFSSWMFNNAAESIMEIIAKEITCNHWNLLSPKLKPKYSTIP